MKLANVESNGRPRVALVVDDELVDLTAQFGEELDDALKFLNLGEDGRALAERCSNPRRRALPWAPLGFARQFCGRTKFWVWA